MKKLMLGMMVTALALGALGEDDANPLIVSENFFGSIKVDSKSEFTMVAAPFEGFASQFEGTAVPNSILARDVVAVEALNPADTMSIFKPEAQDATDEFDNYIARKASVKIGKVSYDYMEWLASMWFDEENMTSHKFPDPDVRLVPVGTGVFVGRDIGNNPATGFSIYAYGQIPQSFDYTQAITLNEGKTILSGPGELAYKAIDLNKLVWDVTTSEVSGTVRENQAYVQRYGVAKILTGVNTPAGADFVSYYDTETQAQKTFVRYGGRWIRMITASVASLEDDATIPAGLSFWYVRNAKDGSAALTWVAGESAGDGDGE